jgi:hypothetical protein
MNVEFSQEHTTHLIVNSEKIKFLDQSTKIQMIKRSFKEKVPKIVKFEWFLQCLLNGEKEQEEQHLIDIN